MLRALEAQWSWGALGALLGALWTFLGPPDRYDGHTCWLIHLYGDFGVALGGCWDPLGNLVGVSWGPLGRLLRFLGASWEPLGELLVAFCHSLLCSISNFLHYRTCLKHMIFRVGSSTRLPLLPRRPRNNSTPSTLHPPCFHLCV